MDARNQLWTELIFPWCDMASLLRLRVVCRDFCAQLAASRAWRPWTMLMAGLRLDERVLGWQGVMKAKARDELTLTNCEAGHTVLGPAIRVEALSCALTVAGRVVAFCADHVSLFDVATGAHVAVVNDVSNYMSATTAKVVADRWMPFVTVDGRALLLDCVTARVAEFAPHSTARTGASISTSGARFLYQRRQDHALVLMQIVTVDEVQEVARVPLRHDRIYASLCDMGHSCLLFDADAHTMQLLDIVSGFTTRDFVPRKPAPTQRVLRSHCVSSGRVRDEPGSFFPRHRLCRCHRLCQCHRRRRVRLERGGRRRRG